MDLDTFIIMIYVFVEEWYEKEIAHLKPKRGRPSKFSEAEMLTVSILSEWRSGVAWQSERGCVRYLALHYREWFPHMPRRSTFNQRKRRLMGVFIRLQQDLADQLSPDDVLYESVDSLPIPAGSTGQYTRDASHWLWLSQIGRGTPAWFWGDRLLMSVTPQGAITGWLIGSANVNDRWLMELFLSSRQGMPQLSQPPRAKHQSRKRWTSPPPSFFGMIGAIGRQRTKTYIADGNFNGQRWIKHWQSTYHVDVLTKPKVSEAISWSKDWESWLASHRQIVETVFALLCAVFDIKRLNVHSRWGQYTRIAIKTASHNLALYFNRILKRPPLATMTLLVG